MQVSVPQTGCWLNQKYIECNCLRQTSIVISATRATSDATTNRSVMRCVDMFSKLKRLLVIRMALWFLSTRASFRSGCTKTRKKIKSQINIICQSIRRVRSLNHILLEANKVSSIVQQVRCWSHNSISYRFTYKWIDWDTRILQVPVSLSRFHRLHNSFHNIYLPFWCWGWH